MPREYNTTPRAPRTKDQLMAARTEAIEAIELLLEDGPMTLAELEQKIAASRQTLLNYLRYMHKVLRTARMLDERRGRGSLWALGPDPSLPPLESRPATVVTIRRDDLVAALFGPAPQ